MTVSEIIQSYCVKVNDGSGVLVNAMTRDYSYVLTAAHVLTEKQGNTVVHDYQDNPIEVLFEHIPQEWLDSNSDNFDFAVIKVTYQKYVEQKCVTASDLTDHCPLTLVGFPMTERASPDPIKLYPGYKISVTNKLTMMSLDGIPGMATISGMSGGGVYYVQDEKPLLIGVEFQMDGTGQEQQYGRVQCHSLARFEELITTYSSAPMIPAYLECFSNMQDKIFSFNVYDQNNVATLRSELKSAADYLIKDGLLPPYKVMEKYHSDLLVDPKNLGELKSYELWIAYLEFIVISVLIDKSDTANINYLEGLERKRRLLYTNDATNWISRLEDLLKAAQKLLDKDGTLIVASPETAARELPPPFQLESVISDISFVPNQGPFPAIDIAKNEIFKSFKLTHLEGLRKKCVVDIEDEYQKIEKGSSHSNFLREKLNEIIN